MQIYYDTEFLEDGLTISLISIGMVRPDGKQLYLINDAIMGGDLHHRICANNWLLENVVSQLPLRAENGKRPWGVAPDKAPGSRGWFCPDSTSNLYVPRRYIRNAVRDFISEVPEPQLWAWFGAYDHVALAQLFGTMSNLPPNVPMWTNDLEQLLEERGIDPTSLPQQQGQAHNALDDARHLMLVHQTVMGYGPL